MGVRAGHMHRQAKSGRYNPNWINWVNGADGENRTHDLSLTKGLRYHYATTATVVFPDPKARILKPEYGRREAAVDKEGGSITHGFGEGKPRFRKFPQGL